MGSSQRQAEWQKPPSVPGEQEVKRGPDRETARSKSRSQARQGNLGRKLTDDSCFEMSPNKYLVLYRKVS